ncbi:hypothetical protein A6302_01536 [Methylobrevis pamukkalensis]|uniref:Uncharacterized protein n=2 Tax=Methylobrevis pamukkalensis TaxID=1439726 RepID=A0A1E3H4C8_9HYPH|nr:hypothetical protein A6302_01536 [Methylobrevis pamukkalensis]
MIRSHLAILATAVLGSAAAVSAIVGAADARLGGGLAMIGQFQPGQGFSANVGDKRVIGYFLDRDGGCATTVMISQATGTEADASTDGMAPVRPEAALPAARVEFMLADRAAASVRTPDGAGIEIACGGAGRTLTLAHARQGVI